MGIRRKTKYTGSNLSFNAFGENVVNFNEKRKANTYTWIVRNLRNFSVRMAFNFSEISLKSASIEGLICLVSMYMYLGISVHVPVERINIQSHSQRIFTAYLHFTFVCLCSRLLCLHSPPVYPHSRFISSLFLVRSIPYGRPRARTPNTFYSVRTF